MQLFDFYKDKRVLVTGHTGFKGSWLCEILLTAGANVTGYAMEAPTDPNLFAILGLGNRMNSVRGDVRDFAHLRQVFEQFQPEVVFHLAAQPIVRTSYEEPVYTYETNVMGTVHVCECIRHYPCVKSFLNVTTDKVYCNREWEWGYREDDPLDGYDPYSNSKSCSELVTHSYISSFYNQMQVAVSTARAGNVIGGGDFAKDRIIPDCIRAAFNKETVIVRNPYSIRPFQHVLEPLYVYLLIAARQYENKAYAGFYNVGPDDGDCINTGKLAEIFCQSWGEGQRWKSWRESGAQPHEAGFLKLDCSRLKKVFGWRSVWNIETAVEKTTEWTRTWRDGGDIGECTHRQIRELFMLHEKQSEACWQCTDLAEAEAQKSGKGGVKNV